MAVKGQIKMRHVIVLSISLLPLAACQKKPETAAATVDAAPASAQTSGPMSPPKRKPGLWSQTVSTQGMTQTSKLCLDEATEAKMTIWGQQIGKNICVKNEVRSAPGGWSFESQCDMGGGGGKVATSGTVTGDFNASYKVKATSVTTGSSMAQINGTHAMEMIGTWEGACPAGMKAGDMTLPGGMKMNLNDLAAMKN